MRVLVAGASGATGRLLVEQLIGSGVDVTVIIRSSALLPDSWENNEKVSIFHANILEIADTEMSELVKDFRAVVSCLGHNLTLKGIYGKPRRLVADAVRKLCEAITTNEPKIPVKFILMNTTGNSNHDLNESIPMSQKVVVGLLRLLLPPQIDSEEAADYLRTQIGQSDKYIQWVAVRPDSLVDEEEVSNYELFPSPIRNAIFDAGKTSRVNVAHFMTRLISEDDTWDVWKGQMPVIYNATK